MTFTRDTNPVGFSRMMMNAITDGRPFAEAVDDGYATYLHTLWLHVLCDYQTARRQVQVIPAGQGSGRIYRSPSKNENVVVAQ